MSLKLIFGAGMAVVIIGLIVLVIIGTVGMYSDQEIIDQALPTPTIVPVVYKEQAGNPPPDETESSEIQDSNATYDKYDLIIEGEIHSISGTRYLSAYPIVGSRFEIYGSITFKRSSITSSLAMIPYSLKAMFMDRTTVYLPPEIPTEIPDPATTPHCHIVLVVDGVEVRHTTAVIMDHFHFKFTLREIREGEHIISVFACYPSKDNISYPMTGATKHVNLTGDTGYIRIGHMIPTIKGDEPHE